MQVRALSWSKANAAATRTSWSWFPTRSLRRSASERLSAQSANSIAAAYCAAGVEPYLANARSWLPPRAQVIATCAVVAGCSTERAVVSAVRAGLHSDRSRDSTYAARDRPISSLPRRLARSRSNAEGCPSCDKRHHTNGATAASLASCSKASRSASLRIGSLSLASASRAWTRSVPVRRAVAGGCGRRA